MKQTKQIIEIIKQTDKSPEYYQFYPRLFKAYFPEVKSDIVNKLCDAGYLYYHSVLMMDSLFDEKALLKVPQILMLQEEAIKILTSIYGEDSELWDYWNKRKNEYFEAIKI